MRCAIAPNSGLLHQIACSLASPLLGAAAAAHGAVGAGVGGSVGLGFGFGAYEATREDRRRCERFGTGSSTLLLASARRGGARWPYTPPAGASPLPSVLREFFL